ncbi:Protein TOPLESS [Euphorbia peplus]|nr:Protein TOPLESS [Euphorbia peplus]
MSSALTRELVFLILQHFNEEGFHSAARMLEQDSGLYFNMNFFEELILNGKWDEAEKYLSGFTKLGDDRYSAKIYFDIRKQKFLETLDKNDRNKALEILIEDLKVFAPENQELYTEMARLLTFNNIREHDSLTGYTDTKTARRQIMDELRKIIEASPLFCNKLEFPGIKCQRLRRLINQALNWQHLQCKYSQPDPVINTLFEDHVCLSLEDYLSTSSNKNPLDSSMPAPVSSANLKSASTVTDSEIFGEPFCFGCSINQDGIEDANVKSGKLCSDEETSAVTHQEDLPKSPLKNAVTDAALPETVARVFTAGSSPTSMDFHPVQQTLLLVGTRTGDIGLWEVSSGNKLVSRSFQVWDLGACSTKFKATLVKDPYVSVNRIAWNPEGSLFGVAYSKHMVQVYSFLGLHEVEQHLEIDAHVGGVNDLAFAAPMDKQLVITCGDDKTVKAWDINTGVIMHNFEGHKSPVYSVFPQTKENIHFIFSISVDGNIKAWLYDDNGARVDYVAPGLGRTSIAYSADNRRLFTCGTSKTGESFLVEWNESEGAINRTFDGLQKNSLAVVKFDIMKNQFLAAGDEHVIKIWDMDQVALFKTVDAEGGLPENPLIRFNKDGLLLAVSANENKFKILASESGLQLLHNSLMCSSNTSSVLSDTSEKNENLTSTKNKKYEYTGEAGLEVFEINNLLQCHTLWLPSSVKSEKISGLAYNNAGNAILALASNAVHLLWKWQVNDLNSSGKATTEVPPQLWQPKNCSGPMTNDLLGDNKEGTLHCFALSKNDSYLLSASGGKVSLFNVLAFKEMLSIMSPPPVTTSIAFLPEDNNIIALGTADSTIIIYHVRTAKVAKVVTELVGHSKRVSSLAFSKDLNMLFSSGADAQIFAWNVKGWEKCGGRFLQIPDREKNPALVDTHIQIHPDQRQLLAVHQTCLAIFEAKTLDCVKKWVRVDPAPISGATFSCDGLMVYACFVDGTVSVFDASNLTLRCRINSIVYVPPIPSFDVHPVNIAAHPEKPNQFALGLTNGGVVVFEPLKTTGKWIESLDGEK